MVLLDIASGTYFSSDKYKTYISGVDFNFKLRNFIDTNCISGIIENDSVKIGKFCSYKHVESTCAVSLCHTGIIVASKVQSTYSVETSEGISHVSFTGNLHLLNTVDKKFCFQCNGDIVCSLEREIESSYTLENQNIYGQNITYSHFSPAQLANFTKLSDFQEIHNLHNKILPLNSPIHDHTLITTVAFTLVLIIVGLILYCYFKKVKKQNRNLEIEMQALRVLSNRAE